MNSREAFKIDTEFYVDFDAETKLWCVFGDKSGFCYETCSDAEQAAERRDERYIAKGLIATLQKSP